MATNIIRDDDRTTVIEAVGADYASGDFIVDGLLHGVSLNNVANGADAVVQTVGEFTYTKTAGQAWTEGQELYFDAGNDRFTTTMTADGIVRGYAAKAALLAATSGEIQLCPGHYASEASMVAYDNSTSGLAATDVGAAIDEIDSTVDDLGTDKMDLVSAAVAGDLIEMDATGQGVPSGLTTADVVVTTDVRLTDARTPTAHAASHATAGTDAITPADIGACADNDARLTDTRTPTAHAASHATGQADAIAPSAIGAQAVVVAAVENNLASFDAAGSTKDSGIAAASIAGAVTMGGIYNDQMRNATNLAQSLADATEEVIDLEDVELAGDVTYAAGTTSLATIPVGGTGLYAIVYGATFAAGAGTYNQIAIKISGTTRASEDTVPDNANPIVVEGNVMLPLAAGDTVGLYAKQDSGGALDVTAAYMAIQRLQ